MIFWKSQWWDQCYFCHGSNQSAGVAILLNTFNGDVIDSTISDRGRQMNNFNFKNRQLLLYNLQSVQPQQPYLSQNNVYTIMY